MTTARKVLLALGVFAAAMTSLVGLALLLVLIFLGGPQIGGYVAGILGLGVVAESIITVTIFMALPAAMITYLKLKFND